MNRSLIAMLTGILSLGACKGLAAAEAPANLPGDEQYVTVKDGHLSVGGQRLRLWCVIGGFPNHADIKPGDNDPVKAQKKAKAYADAPALLDRFTDLGFNGMRLWRYAEKDYVKGDGSNEDVLDYFIALARQKGFHIWVPGISHVTAFRADQAQVINDPATAAAWATAIQEAADKKIGSLWIARVWDARMEELQRQQITRRATHFNQHTGLRWCDDPVFAVWELTNEEWWMSKMVGGSWRGLPKFFQDSLAAQWHDYLKLKYESEAKLTAAWGFLLPGESLAKGTVRILPLRGAAKLNTEGMDATALKQMQAAYGSTEEAFGRDDFNRQRGADVIEFFLQLQLAHKKRLGDHLKSLGKSTKLAPVVYDTGIGYEAQSQYLQQAAEAVAHDAYINGTARNPLQQRWPWWSGLEEWPRICQDVPWLEHNKVEGKPFLCYETQIQQPAKYRAEFPLRLLALASIQDWDAVCWHYWGAVGDITTSPRPFDRPMDNTVGGHPQGYHYTFDEVQNAMMRAAGLAFRRGTIAPAPRPTTFIYGKRSLYDPASMDYAGSYGKVGWNMLPTTYQHGVRIQIDPNFEVRKLTPEARKKFSFTDERTDAAVIGPMVDFMNEARHTIIQPNAQITFDTQRGGLTFDAPGAAMFTGFMTKFGPRITFKNGVTLSQVAVQVPPDMPYQDGIAEEKYIGFAVVSEDGKPLAQAQRITVALVSTSFNTGFKFHTDNNGKTVNGTLPVLVARVTGVIESPALSGMKYVLRDWHMQDIGRGVVAEGKLTIPADKPVWVIELTR